jgi:hypothetical protein
MDSFARTGKSNRVLPAYEEICLKAKRRAVSANSFLARRPINPKKTSSTPGYLVGVAKLIESGSIPVAAIPATVSVPSLFMEYIETELPLWLVT